MDFDTTEDFLEHFGVKGMRWGHRSADNGGAAAASDHKARNKELNSASRANDKAARQKQEAERKTEILAARKRAYGGENEAKVKAAKEKYQQDKMAIGSREAKKALNKVKDEAFADAIKSQEYLNGKEFIKDLALTVALPTVAGTAVSVIARNRTIKKSIRDE